METCQIDVAELPFSAEAVYRHLKMTSASPSFPEVQTMVPELYRRYRQYLRPCFRYDIREISRKDPAENSIYLDDGIRLQGIGVYRRLALAQQAAVFVATLGRKIDRVLIALGRENVLEAYLLQGIADTQLHALLSRVEATLRQTARTRGCEMGRRFAPGYARWKLPDQKQLLDLLRAEEIGVTLSEAFFMNPLKTITGIYGFAKLEKVQSKEAGQKLATNVRE